MADETSLPSLRAFWLTLIYIFKRIAETPTYLAILDVRSAILIYRAKHQVYEYTNMKVYGSNIGYIISKSSLYYEIICDVYILIIDMMGKYKGR